MPAIRGLSLRVWLVGALLVAGCQTATPPTATGAGAPSSAPGGAGAPSSGAGAPAGAGAPSSAPAGAGATSDECRQDVAAPDAADAADAAAAPDVPDAPGAPNAQLVAALPSAQVAERAVGASALAIRDALVRQDFAAVARHVAPGRGVCLAASKGAACRFMSRAELAACGKSQRRERWAVDSGRDEPFLLTCRQAMRQIFLGHEGLARASPSYNCFRRRPDNSGAALLRPALGAEVYVELFADDPDLPGEGFGWRSLWLVFAPAGPDAHHLVALVSHYWSI